MKTKSKLITKVIISALIVLLFLAIILLSACSAAETASRNISSSADAFNITRRLVVINTRTDNIEAEIIGTFSLQDSTSNELEVIVCLGMNADGEPVYIKNFIQLNANIHYHVEDLSYANLPKYYYSYIFEPETLTDVHNRTDDLP